MNASLQKAQLLFAQSRFDLAERELRGSLASDPEDWLSHAMLAFALLRQEKVEDAIAEARAAIGYMPDAAYAHYVLALALSESKDAKVRKGARAAAAQALELEPENPDNHSLLGWLDLEEKRWKEALENAERALSLEPEHVQGANIRAQALVKLGRGVEAGLTLGSALAREPEDAMTHANMGWTLLETGDHKQALVHFRESLRLDPTSEWAREGIVEAMKARNIIYRGMLKYFFMMSKLQGRAQWMLILGLVFGVRIIRGIGEKNPGFAPIASAITVLYTAFVAATWLSRPLFNLVLRLDRFGRLCLSEDQIRGSNWLGATLGLALFLAAAGFATGNDLMVTASLGCLAFCLPVAGVFEVRDPGRRKVHFAIAIGLAGVGIAALLLPGPRESLGMFFVLGVVAYSWFYNLYK